MSGRVLHFESPAHREIDALLPWYVNRTLTDDEYGRVEAHLSECARCQRELDWLCELRSAASEPGMPTEDHADASLERLRGHEARLVVMFDPSLTENQLRALVQGNGARIVDGPGDTGAYVLAVPQPRAGQALAALRHAQGVRMVARLTPGSD